MVVVVYKIASPRTSLGKRRTAVTWKKEDAEALARGWYSEHGNSSLILLVISWLQRQINTSPESRLIQESVTTRSICALRYAAIPADAKALVATGAFLEEPTLIQKSPAGAYRLDVRQNYLWVTREKYECPT